MCTDLAAVMTYRALRDAGLTRSQLSAELRAGTLVRLRRGVYATAAACPPMRAAVAHGGRLACISAARHLGLWLLADDPRPHVWMRRAGRRYHRTPCDCVEHWDAGGAADGLDVPDTGRVLEQLLRCRGVEEFFVALESARRRGAIDARGLRRLAGRVDPEGREAVALSRDDADSGLESLLRWRLRGFGLPVRTQVRIFAVGVVDVLIGDRLIVELDGRDNHDGASLRHKDLLRDANAAAWGYVTLRFDYAQVVHDWPSVEAAILGLIDAGIHLTSRATA